MAGTKRTTRSHGVRQDAVSSAREAALLKRAMAIARMGYWRSAGPGHPTLWISPELSDMYGLATRDGFLPVAEIRARFLGTAPEELARGLACCWQDGTPYSVHVQYRHPLGQTVDFAVHGEAERDATGAITGISGIVRDISEEQAALRSVTDSEQRLSDFIGTASDWCWQTGPDHRFLPLALPSERNSAILTIADGGLARWELPIVPEHREAMQRHRADMENHRPFRDFVYTVVGPGGECATIRSSGKPVFDELGVFQGYRGTASNVTDLRVAEDLLVRRTAALAEAHRLGRMGSWHYRLGSDTVAWSEELFALTGYDPATFDLRHEAVLTYFEPADAEKLVAMQKQVLKTGSAATADLRFRCADGRVSDFALNCKAELADGKVIGLIGTVQDISERKLAQRQLEELAFTDSLTGLANRTQFKRSLTSMVGRALLEDRFGALLLIDLDRFKEVNDSLGHAAGDELLCRVAGLLRHELGGEAFIARLGGDEFAVLVERPSIRDDMRELAEHLIARLSGPIDLANGEAFVGATVGIAKLPEDAATTELAMRNADLALCMAKETGRGRCMVFEPAYAEAVEQRLLLARDLRHAIEENELHAQYQPQVDIATGRVVGFEALLRWTHRERGPISPAVFIPVAESSGIIVDLGLWVLREACRQGRAWLDQGLPPRTIAVNVSPAQFWNMDFETAVSAVLAETGLPPNLLCLELTESLFVDQSEHQISRTLGALSGLGVRLALDDFGSGYSSLGYLTRLPFDRLKVDRSFVDGVSIHPEKRKLLGGIIALSRGLGMSVVAEGAERAAEVDVLRELGCDVVQGYVYSRPVAPDKAPVVADAIERTPLVEWSPRPVRGERSPPALAVLMG
jgi:diguanylate cyclase (GGDEF)-like protein/PAS domain S-box-containing protein